MSHTQTIQTSTGSGLASYWSGIADRYRRYRTYRTTLTQLRGLSPRELDDLGLNTALIRSTAYKAAYEG